MNSQIKTCQSLRYSWGLDDVAPKALLWIINVVLVFVALQGPTRSILTPSVALPAACCPPGQELGDHRWSRTVTGCQARPDQPGGQAYRGDPLCLSRWEG